MTRCPQLDALESAAGVRITCLLNAINRRVAKASLPEAVKSMLRGGILPRLRGEVRPVPYASPRAALQITVEARIP
jgi:hypothetical protein